MKGSEPPLQADNCKAPGVVKNPIIRGLLLATGWLAVVLGVVGIFLPLLPTTPFLLLAAACFVRTSGRFYQWLLGHPHLGPYVLGYLDGSGLPLKAKVYTLLLMWGSLLLSAFFILDSRYARVLLPLIGVGVTVYILRLPTLRPNSSDSHSS
ncbi:YbaN family protein [Parathalassolituus penaei]|uniref:YbaN family protein n=1 Tax=Parathalassolituus penaei TaxID=2997323 RepID=A0A9X3EF43_9GAMM|nr:YbaN family protein [Parathalassolituus penaei]MCY0966387.1 YbaN family protein [Parathalassolituus penaei]